ncbi:MAG TPA: prolyl oligopeptidase family serine peptidase [Pyrinomonadaceae bacterium]|nr:prolyl oligopeptidase family serine peptidase [Pyrinomonadaceae bacterium]
MSFAPTRRATSPVRLLIAFILLTQILPAAFAQKSNADGAAENTSKPHTYPAAKKVEQVDDYHGTKVADPYRWLEDLDTADTKAWVEAQNRLTNAYLAEIPARQRIKERLTKLWNFERYGIPFREGDRYFFTKNDGLQNQYVLYTAASLTDEPRVLLDPNKLSTDGTIALAGTAISRDGKLMAYGLSASGSDWSEWKVRNIETGQDLPDVIKWVKFSGASWTPDGKGFYYSRYDEPKAGTSGLSGVNEFQKLYYHRLGTPQAEDALIYDRKDQKDWGFSGDVTDDGRYLIITVWTGTDVKNRIYYKDLQAKDAPVVKLLDDFDAAYNFIDNDGAVFWFMTDKDAPRNKIIAVDTRKPERANWKTVIPEAAETIESVNVINNMLVVAYLKDAHSQVKVYKLDGSFLREVQLPGIGSVSGLSGKRTDKETFYAYASFTTPYPIYRYDMETGKSTLYRQPKVDFNPNDYETRQVFFNSKDGTRVPMFITHKKGLKLDGTNPTLLYGYGGFNVNETPGFSVSRMVWMEMGGVFALANLRGGGEYGKDWHEAGMKLKKQNVFDDFIAAAEWLIANKYTSTPKLAIQGGSNGGLLVGAAITQRPDLFGAALPAVGVMDMLRFSKFTIGAAWVSDYGSPDNPEEFKALYAYSPLHNLKPGRSYPPTLITTADHDDRVWPGHSFKFAAAMQAAQGGSAPVLIRIETKAGHGAGKPTSKIIEEYADLWGFLVRTLNMNVPAS